MKVLIKVFYFYNDHECLQKGVFPVKYKDYKIDPDQAAADSAAVFVRVIQKMFPEMKIKKVLYSDGIDITELVEKRV